MKTQIVYVLVSRETDLYLEELWVSLYSLRRFHQSAKVTVLADLPTVERRKGKTELSNMINNLQLVDVPEDYSPKERTKEIKTSIRNLIDGDFLFIDTDTVICQPLDEIDDISSNVNNIAMVPELHDVFKKHLTYNYVSYDVKRIFGTDVTDSPYWFNTGCMLVKDNAFMREYFAKWNANWKYSAFTKGNSTDQRSQLKTDHDYGYITECLPDVYNCQMAMSLKYFFDAKILHFWHMRKTFTPNMNFSPFLSHDVYRLLRKSGTINSEISNIIVNIKSEFRNDTMICGEDEIEMVFSPMHTVLWKSYKESKVMHWFLDKLVYCTNMYYRVKRKVSK